MIFFLKKQTFLVLSWGRNVTFKLICERSFWRRWRWPWWSLGSYAMKYIVQVNHHRLAWIILYTFCYSPHIGRQVCVCVCVCVCVLRWQYCAIGYPDSCLRWYCNNSVSGFRVCFSRRVSGGCSSCETKHPCTKLRVISVFLYVAAGQWFGLGQNIEIAWRV